MESGAWEIMPDGSILIHLDAAVYSETAALKTVHELSAKCSGTVSLSANQIDVRLTSGEASNAKEFLRRVNDYAPREKLDSETGPLRDMILVFFGDSVGFSSSGNGRWSSSLPQKKRMRIL